MASNTSTSNTIENLCRVCMGVASRNMFRSQCQSLAISTLSMFGMPGSSTPAPVSSFDKLVEKLRYVSMIKVEDRENYPKMMCDLCIIQLNVAYNFKRLAVETSTKLDQFVIENGLNNNGTRNNVELLGLESHRSREFAVSLIKTEIDDGDNVSEITIQTNTDPGQPNNNESAGFQSSPSTSHSSSQQFSQFDSQSITMVQIGTHNIQSATTHSDIDFINNYLPAEHSRRTYAATTSTTSNGLIVANAKKSTPSNKTTTPSKKPTTPSTKSTTPSKKSTTPSNNLNTPSKMSNTLISTPKPAREVINLNESRSEFRAAINPGNSQRHLLRSCLHTKDSRPKYSYKRRRAQNKNVNNPTLSSSNKTNKRKSVKTTNIIKRNPNVQQKVIQIRENDLFRFAHT